MESFDPWLAPAIGAVAAIIFLGGRAIWRAQRFLPIEAWEHGLLYRRGRFVRELPPGRYRLGHGDSYRAAVVVPQTQVTAPQEALTSDRFQVRLSAMVTWRLAPERMRAVTEANAVSVDERVRLATGQALRQVIGMHALDDLLGPRAAVDAAFDAALRGDALVDGVEILATATRDLLLAADVRRMLTDAERARRESLAALERARGEQAVLRSLANSARMLKGNPALMNLRLLQALQPAPGRGRPTVVLGGGTGLVPIVAEEGGAEETGV